MLNKITAKDIANLMDISLRTAEKYYTDIKKEYKLRSIVTKFHLFSYLKVYNNDELEELLLKDTL